MKEFIEFRVQKLFAPFERQLAIYVSVYVLCWVLFQLKLIILFCIQTKAMSNGIYYLFIMIIIFFRFSLYSMKSSYS